ncbi:hypothetical protein [Aestuariibaculum lutulentum]|uniref:Uncharacterized protein n=1 Tax=Aestuariibaculum lutulentum TaxID=2920935 RepID=A0ABS9REI9_9FLAO|nr:hypothetical protein [Aestuariibaculum lutulentum]MCH4551373.1 hypothetical protein [Aestuariibaculum lutulentum]
MKHLKHLLPLILFTITLFSCSKDDDNEKETSSNYIKIDTEDLGLKGGIIEDYGDFGNGTYNLDLTLYSSNVTYDGNSEPNGSGVLMYFEIFSETPEVLKPGIYSWINYEDPITTFSFDEGYIYQFDNLSSTYEAAFVSGTLTVKNSSKTQYEISFEGVDENGKTITGYYKGAIAYSLEEEM